MNEPSAKEPIPVHVLYLDVVDSTRATVDKQDHVNTRLRDVVSSTQSYQEALSRDELLRVPAGDGMALIFTRKFEGPLQCAIEIARALRRDPFCRLRMGIHVGPIMVENDISGRPNASGDGINLAARVMSCGDDGHILLTRAAADLLRNLDGWKDSLHRIGDCQIKKDQLEVWSYCDGAIGSSVPLHSMRKVRGQRIGWTAVGLVFTAVLIVVAYGWIRPSQTKSTSTSPSTVEEILGVDFWRMRVAPKDAEVIKRGLIYKSDPKGEKSWTPERVTLNGSVREGDNVRITVESSQPGFLYVVNRDVYGDGTLSDPGLIFPHAKIRNGENHIVAHQRIGIPSINDSPPTFTVERTRGNQSSILLIFVLAPQPLAELSRSESGILSGTIVTEWLRRWGANVQFNESTQMAGQLFSRSDLLAEQSASSTFRAKPMIVFRKNMSRAEPFVATANINLLSG